MKTKVARFSMDKQITKLFLSLVFYDPQNDVGWIYLYFHRNFISTIEASLFTFT